MESPTIETPAQTPPPITTRRKGKIARLTRVVREQLNTMLLDGVSYGDIIKKLGPNGQGLNEQNISNWKDGGYKDWLREARITEAIQLKHELAESIVARSGDDNAAGQAVLQVIATNLCEFLAEADPTTLRDSLLEDADKFTRFVNSMVRLAEGGIKCELHKFKAQDRAAEATKQQDQDHQGGISEAALLKAEEKLNLL